MSVARTMILNFMSKEDCKKYQGIYEDFVTSLKTLGLEEFHLCKASEDSLLYFALYKSEKSAEQIITKANEWREKYDFKLKDTIVFDAELVKSVKFKT